MEERGFFAKSRVQLPKLDNPRYSPPLKTAVCQHG